MKKLRTEKRHILKMVLVVCLLLAMVIPVAAADINQAVTEAKNGVVQIQIWYVDHEMADNVWLASGTGFLINENTVVTCYHVVEGFSDEWYALRALETSAILGRTRTAEDLRNNLELRISVLRDVYVEATVIKSSSEMDYAILSLNNKLHNRTPLKLRSSADLKQTEAVYALGFPGDIDNITDVNYYDTDDVTITSGDVNKVGRFNVQLDDGRRYENVDCVEHSALLVEGNSGGPLLDGNGAVVGINAARSDTRNLSIASDQLIATLDALGISYTKSSEPAIDPSEATTPTEPLETEPAPTDTPATKPAPTEPATTEPNPNAGKSDDGNMMIIILAAAVIVIILVVVVVIVATKGKGDKQQAPTPVGGGYVPPAPPRPVQPTGGFTSAPITSAAPVAPAPAPAPVAPAAVGETTVLSQNAGETTVLSKNINGGSLTRKKNNETVRVNSESFVIGRERKTVNYCISDNSSIGRNHARLIIRNGKTYLVDMKSTNGTYVNGVKAMPNQEVELKNGDKITLADEDLEFNI